MPVPFVQTWFLCRRSSFLNFVGLMLLFFNNVLHDPVTLLADELPPDGL